MKAVRRVDNEIVIRFIVACAADGWKLASSNQLFSC